MDRIGPDSILQIKLLSGGQTGVDRAALDVALSAGISTGGWCPRGRIAVDGPIAARYPLAETPSSNYEQRTDWNVRDSGGTLILIQGLPDRGSRYTLECARRRSKPFLIIDLDTPPEVDEVLHWLRRHRIGVLNVAGPREQNSPGIYHLARAYLEILCRHLRLGLSG